MVSNEHTVHSTNDLMFQFIIYRQSKQITWAQVGVTGNPQYRSERVAFPPDSDAVTNWVTVPFDVVAFYQRYFQAFYFDATVGGPLLLRDATGTFFGGVILENSSANNAYQAGFVASVNCSPEQITSRDAGCLSLNITPPPNPTQELSPPSDMPVNYFFTGYDPSHGADWVEIYLRGTAATNRIARLTPGTYGFQWLLKTNSSVFPPSPFLQPQFYLRAGGNGRITPMQPTYLSQRPSGSNEAALVNFIISANCNPDIPGGGAGGIIGTDGGGRIGGVYVGAQDCSHTTATGNAGAGPVTINPLKPWFWLTATTREWRIYRRVDGGPLQLIKQGLANYEAALSVTNDDFALPANAAEVCYFAQLFDEHGNPSPISSLGCSKIVPAVAAPAPMLAPVEVAGSELAPQMKISWFCPPAGVDRFEICIAAEGQSPASNVGAEVTPDNGSMSNLQLVTLKDGTTVSENFGYYQTPKASVLGGGSAQFTRTVNVQAKVKYFVFVRSVLNGGSFSKISNVGEFRYVPPPPVIPPGVAWPQRSLPTYNTSLNTNVYVWPLLVPALGTNISMVISNFGTGSDGISFAIPSTGLRWIPGVQIGRFHVTGSMELKQAQIFHSDIQLEAGLHAVMDVIDCFEQPVTNVNSLVFTDVKGNSVFPCVLYRTQVPNFYFPKVSGDIIQVTPMMNGIANKPYHPGTRLLLDPFVVPYQFHLGLTNNVASQTIDFSSLFLVDTQPRVINACYAYMLVRFNQFGEVRDVLPCGLYTEPVQ
jgi:hypothetical protein